MCSSVAGSVNAYGCNTGNSGCVLITDPIFYASGNAGKTCWMIKRRTEPSRDNFIRHNGVCVKPSNSQLNGNDYVQIRKNVDYGPSEDKQMECLDLCRKFSQAHKVKGCSAIWGQSNRGCYIFTSSVFKGSGHSKHTCWSFQPYPSLTREDFRPYPGQCLKHDGNNQNSGKFHIANGNFNTEAGKLQCLDKCISYGSEFVKGCQAETSRCYVYTGTVSYGNGSAGKTCFVVAH